MSHSKRSRIGRLPRWQRVPTYAVFCLCAISGVAYFLVHDLDWGSRIFSAHDLLVLHGISTYFILLAFGAVVPGHIRAAWNAKRNRASGTAMVATLSALMLSGLCLYYGTEEMRNPALWLHWIVGASLILVGPLHLLIGKRTKDEAKHLTRHVHISTASLRKPV